MEKRDFLKYLAALALLRTVPDALALSPGGNDILNCQTVKSQNAITVAALSKQAGSFPDDHSLKGGRQGAMEKWRHYDQVFEDDMFIAPDDQPLLESCLERLRRISRQVGYANFALLGFDQALAVARDFKGVGAFSAKEIQFFEKIFHTRAATYGFMGEKPFDTITHAIPKKEVVKISGTGNYLYRGNSVKMYHEVKERIGSDLILTSGIRGVMKQFLLFLDKTCRCQGNLSMASRSLAPPGYSFHGIGDFDVGQKGYGAYNFSEKFVDTRVYHRLIRLGYVKFRYGRYNRLGVRFEPWHIKTV